MKYRWLMIGCCTLLSVGCAIQGKQIQQNYEQIALWPVGHIPGAAGVSVTEQVIERSHDATIHDRAWTHIAHPTLVPLMAEKPNGCSIIIAPGGGYQRIVFDKEGYDVAPILNAKGINVFILKYRLPCDEFAHRSDVPLQDAQRAIRLIRSHAKPWGLNPHGIGIMGFSAGGHVAASLATRFNDSVYPPIDDIDQQDARPDFAALLYPVISMDSAIAHMGSRNNLLGEHPSKQQVLTNSLEKQVSAQTPPTFIALANDDLSVSPLNSIHFYEQLHHHHINTEMHIFSQSGHGFGIRNAKGNAKLWPKLFLTWFNSLNLATDPS